ncbi:hypothetical protein [Dactylosporangium salmoneum]
MRLTRILVVAVTVAATVAIAPQAALATPPGTGWSGSWKYTGGTSI